MLSHQQLHRRAERVADKGTQQDDVLAELAELVSSDGKGHEILSIFLQ